MYFLPRTTSIFFEIGHHNFCKNTNCLTPIGEQLVALAGKLRCVCSILSMTIRGEGVGILDLNSNLAAWDILVKNWLNTGV